MRRSVGELRAEILKACRGAGATLGVAEDLAACAAWLNLPALEALANMLDSSEGVAALERLCTALDDRETGHKMPETAPHGDLWTAMCEARDERPAPAGRIVPPALWARFAALSARTYVPETAQSRARGAGAGNIDND